MKKSDFIKLQKTLQSKFGVFMNYSVKNSSLYCDFVSSACSMRIREFLSSNYEMARYFHFSDGFTSIEF